MLSVITGFPPFSYLSEDGEPRGYYGEVLNDLSLRLNFTFSVMMPKRLVYGMKQSNGSFDGMVGMVARNEADIGVGDFRFDCNLLDEP